jgi:hypothetical protein
VYWPSPSCIPPIAPSVLAQLSNPNLVQEYIRSPDPALLQLGQNDELYEHNYDKRGDVDSSAVNLPLINFNRHMEGDKRQTWARFIWAKSMTWPNSYDPVKPPVVITVPGVSFR